MLYFWIIAKIRESIKLQIEKNTIGRENQKILYKIPIFLMFGREREIKIPCKYIGAY